MAYGTIKVDTVTFTNDGIDKSVTLSGLVQNPTFSGNVTVTGTVSGNTIQGQTISGVTVTGATSTFATGSFVSLTGTTIQGTTASYTGGSFTSLTGVTTSGTTATFVSGVFSTLISGATVTGTTASFTSGVFTNISGGTYTITSGVFAAGSASSPSISFTSDSDTGVYSPGANQVALSTNGTGRLFVDASGKIGLGVASPTEEVDIAGDVYMGTGVIKFANNLGIYGYDTTSTIRRLFHLGTDNNLYFNANSLVNAQIFQTNNTERLRITSAGLVGIGTSSPTGRLHINDGYLGVQYNSGGTYPAYSTYFGAFGSNFSNGGSEFDIWNTVGSGFAFRSQTGASAQSCLMYIAGAGRVGIGTTSPSSTLTVASSDQVALFSSTNANAYLRTTAATNDCAFGADSTGGFFAVVNSAPLLFKTGNTERARIDSSGRLGIGTSSPYSILYAQESNTTTPSLTWQNTAGQIFRNSNVELAFGVSGSSPFSFYMQARDSASAARSLVINPLGGNVGIGTASPLDILDVSGTASVKARIRSTSGAAFAGHLYQNADTGTGATNGLYVGIDDSEVGYIFHYDNNPLAFGTNFLERARIDSSGRLLVGTSSAREINSGNDPLFQIERAAGSAYVSSFTKHSADAFGPHAVLIKTRGTTVGSNTAVVSGDEIGSIDFMGTDGTNPEIGASITAFVDGTPGANDMPGRLVFSVTADGAASPTEALRISSNRAITVSDGGHIVLGTGTGTKIGTSTSQKIGFFDETPIVQPTTGIAEAAFVENSGGTAVNVDSTFGGYTIQQVVQALQNLGLLA